MRTGKLIGVLAMLMLAACNRGAPEAGASPGAPGARSASDSAGVAKVEGITWHEGGIDSAFDTATREHKLVFLYWGAEWCPPCHDLKAHVFPRADFQQALRQFVPVYLDGDAPGAQRIAEQFGVLGYPSVVVLQADRTELARISGGSDLASYADVLGLALEAAQPVDAVLAAVRADAGLRLGATDCRRLAWNDWSGREGDDAQLAAALQLAAARCPVESRAERDRLLVTAADIAAIAEHEAIGQGAAPGAALVRLLQDVSELIADPERRLDSATALLYLGEEFFGVVRHAMPARVPALQAGYFALLDALESDERQSDTVRLLSAARRLQAAKALSGSPEVPPAIAARARSTLNAFLDRDHGPDARAGIVNSASWVLYELGDDVRLRALLEQQMKVSRTPYYYMPDIADIEERAGNFKEALAWLERGYRESTGPATRFQWGSQYVQGLLRMAPEDETRIRAAVLDVIGELAGPERIHARARVRLQRLDAALDAWASDGRHAATMNEIRQRWRGICAGLPAEDPARRGCEDLLG